MSSPQASVVNTILPAVSDLGGGVLAALAVVVVGVALARVSGARRSVVEVATPPEEVAPVVGAWLVHGAFPGEGFAASVLDLARRGVVVVSGSGDRWSVSRTSAGPGQLAGFEQSLLDAMGLDDVGPVFQVDATSAVSGRSVTAVTQVLEREAGAVVRKASATSGVRCAVGAVVVAGLAALGWVSGSWPVWGATVGAGVLAWWPATRGQAAREVALQVAGFERFLSAGATRPDDRNRFAEHLPWVLAVNGAWDPTDLDGAAVTYVRVWNGSSWDEGDLAAAVGFADSTKRAVASYASAQAAAGWSGTG